MWNKPYPFQPEITVGQWVQEEDREQEEEEGGEGAINGGAEGGVITITDYRLRSTDPNAFQYDASKQAAAYAALAFESYSAAHADALKLRTAIAALRVFPAGNMVTEVSSIIVDMKPISGTLMIAKPSSFNTLIILPNTMCKSCQ